MTKKSDKSNTSSDKRNTLKKAVVASSVVVGGTAASGKWASPVVKSLVLPTHAESTAPITPVSYTHLTLPTIA